MVVVFPRGKTEANRISMNIGLFAGKVYFKECPTDAMVEHLKLRSE